MKLQRSENAIRSIRAGYASKIIGLVLPFFVRAIFVRTLGAAYLGVNSLFTSILTVLSLTEMGFGVASGFSMYKAIAEDSAKTINALLYYYRYVYRCVGAVILTIGICLIPFLSKLTHGSYPADINPLLVYLVFLGNTVISAHQREDVISRIALYFNSVIQKTCCYLSTAQTSLYTLLKNVL